MAKKFQVKTLRDEASDIIRELILKGTYKPGQRVNENEFGESLGISRTPVREAMIILEQDGLLSTKKHVGTYVSSFSSDEIIELLHIQSVLEGLAASLAAKNISDQEIKKLKEMHAKFLAENETSIMDHPENFFNYDRHFHSALIGYSKSYRLKNILEKQLSVIYLCRYYTITAKDRYTHSIAEHAKIIEAVIARDAASAERAAKNHLDSVRRDFIHSLSKNSRETAL
jgi:DNA-binding GntR family transcriptional regulator